MDKFMDITPLVPKGKNLISAYGKYYIIINGEKYFAPLIASPDQLILDAKDITQIQELNIKPEIIIIGSDLKQRRDFDIKAEFMSFGAACRTYNILLTEGREVACFLS
jgi:uncharacterized protein